MGFNTVTITNAATEIVSDNSKRVSIIITNTSTDTSVFFAQDNTVTAANAPELAPGGTFTEDAGGTRIYKGPFFAITSAGTADVRYWEREGNI